MMVMIEVGNADIAAVAPVYLSDLTTNDCDITGGVTPDSIVTCMKCEKEGGEHRTPVDLAFQDLSVHPVSIVTFRADLDFPAKQFLPGIDDQRPNVLPNIQHRMFDMNPLNICFSHQLFSAFQHEEFGSSK